MTTMKVLFFDTWLKGVANFTRLMPQMAKHPAVECLMVHTGSWKGPVDKPDTTIDGLRCLDISTFGTNSIYAMLKAVRPDVVVTLNMYNFLDRALVAMCRRLGVRIVYLSHGRFSLASATSLSTLVEQRRKRKKLSDRLNRENRLTYANYAHATWLAGKPWRFPVALWRYLRDPAMRSVNTPYSPELLPDDIMLYYQSDLDVMTRHRHFPPSAIHVVGNPELDAFVLAPIASREQLCTTHGMSVDPYLLYLDDGLPQNGLLPLEQWRQHVAEINTLAHSQGLRLVMKLHPRTDAQALAPFFAEQGITALQRDVDFKSLIHHSHAVTSIFSSTIAFALLLQRRVVSARWGATADFPLSYPSDVVHYSYEPADFERNIASTEPSCTDADYLRHNLGDITSPAIPRIVSRILGTEKA